MIDALVAVFQRRTTFGAYFGVVVFWAIVLQIGVDLEKNFTMLAACTAALLGIVPFSQMVQDHSAGGRAPSKADADKANKAKLDLELAHLRAKHATSQEAKT